MWTLSTLIYLKSPSITPKFINDYTISPFPPVIYFTVVKQIYFINSFSYSIKSTTISRTPDSWTKFNIPERDAVYIMQFNTFTYASSPNRPPYTSYRYSFIFGIRIEQIEPLIGLSKPSKLLNSNVLIYISCLERFISFKFSAKKNLYTPASFARSLRRAESPVILANTHSTLSSMSRFMYFNAFLRGWIHVSSIIHASRYVYVMSINTFKNASTTSTSDENRKEKLIYIKS